MLQICKFEKCCWVLAKLSLFHLCCLNAFIQLITYYEKLDALFIANGTVEFMNANRAKKSRIDR
jgi:hypothetical protein